MYSDVITEGIDPWTGTPSPVNFFATFMHQSISQPKLHRLLPISIQNLLNGVALCYTTRRRHRDQLGYLCEYFMSVAGGILHFMDAALYLCKNQGQIQNLLIFPLFWIYKTLFYHQDISQFGYVYNGSSYWTKQDKTV